MSSNPSDFVDVQLNADGAALAGIDGAITITTPHFSYPFTAKGATRVLISEWSRTLSLETINGCKILQTVPVPTAAAVSEVAAPAATEMPSDQSRKPAKGSN